MTAKKVLVVEDESSIREMLRLALEISDFECVEARDIHEAYRIITDDTPDIVLLDWMLPEEAAELLRRLKKEDATQGLLSSCLPPKPTRITLFRVWRWGR